MATIPTTDRQKALVRRVAGVRARLFRLTKGRVGGSFAGTPVLVLHHVGRKSGEARATPLVYLADGADLLIAASKAGDPKHPAWYHNLVAAPETTVDLRGRSVAVRASVLGPEERAEWWPRFVESNGDFTEYEQAAGGREIPLVRLTPR